MGSCEWALHWMEPDPPQSLHKETWAPTAQHNMAVFEPHMNKHGSQMCKMYWNVYDLCCRAHTVETSSWIWSTSVWTQWLPTQLKRPSYKKCWIVGHRLGVQYFCSCSQFGCHAGCVGRPTISTPRPGGAYSVEAVLTTLTDTKLTYCTHTAHTAPSNPYAWWGAICCQCSCHM